MKARHKDTGEIIELAEEGIISRDGRRFCWYQVELIPEPIDECKPSLPSNLDEAAEEYGRKEYSHAIHFWDEGLSKNKPKVMKEDFVDSFKAGAVWMAGQGVTFESPIDYYDGYYLDCGEQEQNAIEQLSLKVMDKAIVQIRKK